MASLSAGIPRVLSASKKAYEKNMLAPLRNERCKTWLTLRGPIISVLTGLASMNSRTYWCEKRRICSNNGVT
jgi:hypothetical protein